MKTKLSYIVLLIAVFLFAGCANMVTPTGGPKDIIPPKVVKAIPGNGSIGFDGRKVEITFDEYVTLNNASQQVLISPPFGTKPDIKLSNKTVIIKFKEALLPGTTYTVNFGDAIKDLHEGNVFKDYTYSFSTGDWIDTLCIAGKVVNANDEKPASDLFVTLYLKQDSLFDLPTHRIPDFITKTDKDGRFSFTGLPDKSFLVFALEDVNSNLYYDMPNEKVAFLDTLVPASFKQKTDSTTVRFFDQNSLDLTLFAFIEEYTTQMLLEKKLVEEGLLRFVFRRPAKEVNITMPEHLPDTFRMAQVWSKEMDTLCCYFTPKVMDSLWIHIQQDTLVNDSTCYLLTPRETRQRQNAPKNLVVGSNLRNNMLLPGEDLILNFSEPVCDIRVGDTSTFIIGADTTYININKVDFEQVDDYGMAYRFTQPIGDSADYTLNVADSVFFSVRGLTCKALKISFKRAQSSDLGNIFVKVEIPAESQAVIQLLNNKSMVVEERVIDSTQQVAFTQLLPDKYKLRAIIDSDRDGKWSTGNFHRRFLPETVILYKDDLDLKAGWDIDLDDRWILIP